MRRAAVRARPRGGERISDFWDILHAHGERYPQMEPRDFGKLAYQSEFGPEHLLPEGEGFLRRLQEEWSAVPGDSTSPPLSSG